MTNVISHRGPDDMGFLLVNTRRRTHQSFASAKSPTSIQEALPILRATGSEFSFNLAISHVRFSIIDLSSAGHQPMWNSDRTICLTFNGEIYNYLELREELIALGYAFQSTSDTEVLLIGYQAWGAKVFERLNGFFAVCIYDLRLNRLLLGRDRLGKADLYVVYEKETEFVWASEIKSLMSTGRVDSRNVKTSAVADFLLNGRRDRSGTFWENVVDFPPGHFAWVDERCEFNPQRYWQLPAERLSSKDISLVEAADGLLDRLTDSLRIRMRADVPIGFELSGGLDSSALVAIAANRLSRKLKTYTVRFPEEHSNEEPYARLVADAYPGAIDYRVIDPPEQEFWTEADSFVRLQDEPFHAPNLHTNQVVRRKFKEEGVEVVITGAAGDELLAGYPEMYLPPLLRYLLKSGKWTIAAKEIARNTEIGWSKSIKSLVRDQFLSESTVMRLGKGKSGEWKYLKMMLRADLMDFPHGGGFDDPARSFDDLTRANMTSRMMNYWLRSSSKSNYGIPVEVRAPFLDFNVVEYCLRMPPEYLVHDGWHKYLLRYCTKSILPHKVVWRRNKMGFPFPYREWLTKSKSLVSRNLMATNCPLINAKQLLNNYDEMVLRYPVTLWRLISVSLWWRRVVDNEAIIAV